MRYIWYIIFNIVYGLSSQKYLYFSSIAELVTAVKLIEKWKFRTVATLLFHVLQIIP
jgi:hypothetical protein